MHTFEHRSRWEQEVRRRVLSGSVPALSSMPLVLTMSGLLQHRLACVLSLTPRSLKRAWKRRGKNENRKAIRGQDACTKRACALGNGRVFQRRPLGTNACGCTGLRIASHWQGSATRGTAGSLCSSPSSPSNSMLLSSLLSPSLLSSRMGLQNCASSAAMSASSACSSWRRAGAARTRRGYAAAIEEARCRRRGALQCGVSDARGERVRARFERWPKIRVVSPAGKGYPLRLIIVCLARQKLYFITIVAAAARLARRAVLAAAHQA